jgi:hypothetical protein
MAAVSPTRTGTENSADADGSLEEREYRLLTQATAKAPPPISTIFASCSGLEGAAGRQEARIDFKKLRVAYRDAI